MPLTAAFARTLIDAQLDDQIWKISDGISVRYEYIFADGTRSGYMCYGCEDRGLAIVENRRESFDPADAQWKGRHNAEEVGVPFAFLAEGKEILFWDWPHEAPLWLVKTFYSSANRERRAATLQISSRFCVAPSGTTRDLASCREAASASNAFDGSSKTYYRIGPGFHHRDIVRRMEWANAVQCPTTAP